MLTRAMDRAKIWLSEEFKNVPVPRFSFLSSGKGRGVRKDGLFVSIKALKDGPLSRRLTANRWRLSTGRQVLGTDCCQLLSGESYLLSGTGMRCSLLANRRCWPAQHSWLLRRVTLLVRRTGTVWCSLGTGVAAQGSGRHVWQLGFHERRALAVRSHRFSPNFVPGSMGLQPLFDQLAGEWSRWYVCVCGCVPHHGLLSVFKISVTQTRLDASRL